MLKCILQTSTKSTFEGLRSSATAVHTSREHIDNITTESLHPSL